MNNKIEKFWVHLFKKEMEDFLKEIINDNLEYKDRIEELMPNYILSIKQKDNNTCQLCEARVFNNGSEGRCTKIKKNNSDFCTRHDNKLLYGKITEPIPKDYEKKFTKRIELFTTDNSSTKNIEYPINIKAKESFMQTKNNLKRILLNDEIYLYDEITSIVYTNDNNPAYIGKFCNNLIIR